jgi:hypothetical protein
MLERYDENDEALLALPSDTELIEEPAAVDDVEEE